MGQCIFDMKINTSYNDLGLLQMVEASISNGGIIVPMIQLSIHDIGCVSVKRFRIYFLN